MTYRKSDQSIGIWIITVIAVVFGLLIEKLSISDLWKKKQKTYTLT